MNKWLLFILTTLALLLAASPTRAAPESQAAEGDIYIVQANDWLSKLADKYYADLNAFPTIVEATNAMAAQDASFTPILDPDRIEVGQKLWIPVSPALLSEAEVQSDDTLPQVALLPATADTVAFSPDDSLLALGNYQQTIQVWETETWSLLWEAQHEDPVRQVIFSPDGQLLASAGFDNTARLWQAQTGEDVSHLTFDFRVYGLHLGGEGQFLAAGSLNGQSLLLDGATGEAVVEFKHQFPVSDLALSPNAPWLAVISAGKWGPVELAVWDIFTQESRVLAQADGPPTHSNAVFSPDAKWLAASVQSGQPITVWETLIWPEAAHLEKPDGVVHQLAFSPDGTRLAARMSGGNDVRSTVWVWRVPDWQLISTMDQPDVSFAMAFSPDSQFLATGLGQGIEYEPAYEAQLWDVSTGQRIARMPHDSQVLAVAFSYDGRWIATGSPDGTTRIWAMPPK